jgi:hypothetical protein
MSSAILTIDYRISLNGMEFLTKMSIHSYLSIKIKNEPLTSLPVKCPMIILGSCERFKLLHFILHYFQILENLPVDAVLQIIAQRLSFASRLLCSYVPFVHCGEKASAISTAVPFVKSVVRLHNTVGDVDILQSCTIERRVWEKDFPDRMLGTSQQLLVFRDK